MKAKLTALIITAAVSMVMVPSVGAQNDNPGTPGNGDQTTGTTPVDTTPSTSVPSTEPTVAPDPSTTLPAATSSTVPGVAVTPTVPVIPVTTLPPEIANDPRAPLLVDPGPADSGDVPVNQPLFSSINNQVLADKVASSTLELLAAQKAVTDLQTRTADAQTKLDGLQAQVDQYGVSIQQNVDAATKARAELLDHAVNAFIAGSRDQKIAIVSVKDPIEAGVARRYLESAVDSDHQLIQSYDEAKAKLSKEQDGLAGQVSAATTELNNLHAMASTLAYQVIQKTQEVEAYKAGSQVYVSGFVFPVTGPVEFVDSWGFPRLAGTAQAHWHQGTDIMSPMGTPLVACESGVLDKVGQAGLGGNRLWIDGDSGTNYYYAHLSAYAPGIVDGKRVNAGDVVGYVGNTGDAAGGPTHLHFEVHPNRGNAVDSVSPPEGGLRLEADGQGVGRSGGPGRSHRPSRRRAGNHPAGRSGGRRRAAPAVATAPATPSG